MFAATAKMALGSFGGHCLDIYSSSNLFEVDFTSVRIYLKLTLLEFEFI